MWPGIRSRTLKRFALGADRQKPKRRARAKNNIGSKARKRPRLLKRRSAKRQQGQRQRCEKRNCILMVGTRPLLPKINTKRARRDDKNSGFSVVVLSLFSSCSFLHERHHHHKQISNGDNYQHLGTLLEWACRDIQFYRVVQYKFFSPSQFSQHSSILTITQ